MGEKKQTKMIKSVIQNSSCSLGVTAENDTYIHTVQNTGNMGVKKEEYYLKVKH